MIRALNLRERKILLITLTVVFAAILYNGAYLPLRAESEEIDEEIRVLQKLIAGELKKIDRANAVDDRFRSYHEQFYRTGSLEEVTSDILSEIERIAAAINVPIVDLKPGKIRPNEYYDQFTVSLTMNSDLADAMHFLYLAQQKPYVFEIEEMTMDKSVHREPEQIKVRFTLAKTYLSGELNTYQKARSFNNTLADDD